MAKKLIWVIIVIVIAVILASSLSRSRSNIQNGPTEVGVLLPLSGDFVWWGQSIQNGIELAQARGLTGNMDFVYQDTKCDTKDAVSGTTLLKSEYPTMHVFIVGCDNDLKAMLPLLDKDTDMAFVAGLSGSDLYATDFPIINLSYRLEAEASAVSDFAAKKLGIKTLGLIMGNENFDSVLDVSIPQDFGALGGKTVVESMKINDPDPSTAVLKAIASKPDAIYVHNDIPAMSAILKRLDQLGYAGPRIMTYGAHDQSLLDSAGKSAEGFYVPWVIPDPLTSVQQDFVDSYKKMFGIDPFVTSYFVYDGVTLLDEANQSCQGNTQCMTKYFYDKTDFQGILGNVKYEPGGQVERTFYFDQVKDGKFVEVK